MAIRIDPEEFEKRSLLDYTGSLAGKRVLEVGAGDGRLTWRYAAQAAHVTALEPNQSAIKLAEQRRPASLHDSVTLLPTGVEAYELPPQSPAFDVALLSWSL